MAKTRRQLYESEEIVIDNIFNKTKGIFHIYFRVLKGLHDQIEFTLLFEVPELDTIRFQYYVFWDHLRVDDIMQKKFVAIINLQDKLSQKSFKLLGYYVKLKVMKVSMIGSIVVSEKELSRVCKIEKEHLKAIKKMNQVDRIRSLIIALKVVSESHRKLNVLVGEADTYE